MFENCSEARTAGTAGAVRLGSFSVGAVSVNGRIQTGDMFNTTRMWTLTPTQAEC